MKTRQGFVSNSSSSSFIVAVAKVVDEEKVNKWRDSLNLPDYRKSHCKIVTLEDIINNEVYCAKIKKDQVVIESFQADARLSIKGMKEDDKIFYINITNDEGDTGRFSGYDENGEYCDIDYDINLDDFSEAEQNLFMGLTENNGFSNIDANYGAGRNG